tara:strand:+ start:3080 stop:3394 length:315 start_codon:yes stop_codon:yes gene_type:complete
LKKALNKIANESLSRVSELSGYQDTCMKIISEILKDPRGYKKILCSQPTFLKKREIYSSKNITKYNELVNILKNKSLFFSKKLVKSIMLLFSLSKYFGVTIKIF